MQAVRQEFLSALQRIRLHQPDATDSAALQSYVLYDYVLAARLRRELALRRDAGLDESIDGFLQSHPGQPVARGLRRDWLQSLAERHRWDLFLTHSADVTDPLLSCERLQARLSTGDMQGLAAPALLRFMQPQKQPPECDTVFAWLRAQGLLTAALAETRTRAALAADNPRLAREFAADVPINLRPALLLWSDILESPKSALNVLAAHPTLVAEPSGIAEGFDKLAHSDPEAALDLLPRLLSRADLTPWLEARLKRAAALAAAYGHDSRAMALLADVPEEGIDGQLQEWRVRTALWQGQYSQALKWLQQMPASLGETPRWRYWRARAVAMTSGEAAAVPLFREIAGLRDYYGYLAADRLHQKYELNARASPVDPATQALLATNTNLARAHELYECEMSEEATSEWTAGLAGAEPAVKVQAAVLGARWGWYAESIATLASTGEFDDVILRYPRPFLEAVNQAAELAQLSPDWILAVMRQESLFRKDAVSRANARGLMQMLPATAATVARRWHLASPAHEELFDPWIALPLGAAYLRELLDHYSGQLPMTLAAYNAGPGAVARWLPYSPMDADVWIENIPFNETRAYVQHILEHIVAFAWVRGAEPPRLVDLLPETLSR
jgi:soluble lytic murein transglycosylase